MIAFEFPEFSDGWLTFLKFNSSQIFLTRFPKILYHLSLFRNFWNFGLNGKPLKPKRTNYNGPIGHRSRKIQHQPVKWRNASVRQVAVDFEVASNFLLHTLERFLQECRKQLVYRLSTLHLVLQVSEVKQKPMGSHTHTFSRGMGRLHLFTSSRDWFQWLLWLWSDKTQL